MNNLNINLQYCYGIKHLIHNFKFNNKAFAIYAPNGVMKTSLAKTFDDLTKGVKPSDRVFPERETIAEFFVDGEEIDSKNIFVIHSYNANFQSEKIPTLLANQSLKNAYNDVHKDLNKVLSRFKKDMQARSGISGRKNNTVELAIEKAFGGDFYTSLTKLKEEVSHSQSLYGDIQYQEIFNDKVELFLKTEDFQIIVKEYIEKYDQLIEQSPILKKEFQFHHAQEVENKLDKSNFFNAGHSINLFDGIKKQEYKTSESFKNTLESEKQKIFNDQELQSTYSQISKKLTNQDLKKFRSYLLQNKEILSELSDLESFARKLWISYFVDSRDIFLELVEKYESSKKTAQSLISQAAKEKTAWEKVVSLFNAKFSYLPFQLNIKNKEDVILKNDAESIDFVFKEEEKERKFPDKRDLLEVLSMGEQRALYILNIMFEVEARRKEELETIYVADDIADSFDYKNKYAIIEYLKYIADIEGFYLLILTHNFDFYRTINSRNIVPYSQCLIAAKDSKGVSLKPIKYLKNPFINDWKGNLENNKKLIASIPFVRNIIEYTQGTENDNFAILTSILHFKENTVDIKVSQIRRIFTDTIQDINFPNIDGETKVFDLILVASDECLNSEEGINLENKIVLSIAIRIIAERFMSDQISDQGFLKSLRVNQSWQLLKRYSDEFNNREEEIELLNRVNLMTPENIHINSFMYEPILDMGDGDLKELYIQVKQKLSMH